MNDYAKKKTDDVVKLLAEKRQALFDFRFGIAGSRSRNVKEGRTLRREIARILTALCAHQKHPS